MVILIAGFGLNLAAGASLRDNPIAAFGLAVAGFALTFTGAAH